MHNFHLKKLRAFTLSLLFLLSIIFMPINTFADEVKITVPEKPESVYVYDMAEVISESAEENLLTRALNLYNHTEIQISIVTVNSLNGENIEQYANTLLHEWKIGGEEGKGLILLLDIEEDIYVTISGDALKPFFTSGALQEILNEKLEPNFLVGEYERGINDFFTEVYYIAEDVSEAVDTALEVKEEQEREENKEGPNFFSVLFTIILVLVILCAVFIAVVYVRGQIVRKKRREAARRRRAMERRTERSHRDYL